MLRKLSIRFSSLLLVSYLVLPLTNPVFAAPQTWTGRCVGNTPTTSDVATIQGVECLFFNILQVIAVLAGLTFFVMFIIGGFQYLLSSSDSKAVAAASSTLTLAAIGLVGIIISYLILSFIKNFTGVDVFSFVIPGP